MANSKVLTLVADLKADRERTGKTLDRLKEEKIRLEGLAISPAERRAVLFAEIDRYAEDARRRFIGYTVTTENAEDVLFDLLGGGCNQNNTAPVIEFLCFVFNGELKNNLAMAMEKNWPADAISSEERSAKLHNVRSKIREIEELEEEAACELEKLGIMIERRPDLSPAVFLEAVEDGKPVNE